MAGPPAQIVPPAVRTATAVTNSVPVLALDWPNATTIAIGSPSAASSVLSTTNDVIAEFSGNQNCWYTIGITSVSAGQPPATWLGASATRYVYIPKNLKVCVVQDATAGTLCIVPALPGP